MGTGIQWGLKRGKIALLVVLLILVPLRTTGSYNTFFREYDFNFPKNDVIYQAAAGNPNATYRNISLPSMDIIGAKVHLTNSNALAVQMTFGGEPYTNYTTIYDFSGVFVINSTNEIDISVSNTDGLSVGPVDQSTAYITYIKDSKLQSFQEGVRTIIQGDILTWTLDLNLLNSIIPLSKFFTGTNFSNQTQITYQNDFGFYFLVENYPYAPGVNYKYWIYNEYRLDSIGTPPAKPNYFLLWSGIGLVVSLIVLLFILRRRHKEKLIQEKFNEDIDAGKEIMYPNQEKKIN